MGNDEHDKIDTPKIRLIVTKGDDEGNVFETQNFPIIIGRDSQADFPIKKDTNISRIHAEISLKRKRLWLQDLGSTNGCIVNNVRVKNKAELSDGSAIILGKTVLKLVVVSGRSLKKPHDSNDSTFVYNSKQYEAILVIDQCNSSQIVDMYGDEMGLKLTEALNKIALPVFKKYKSQFVKGTGDGFLATFKNAGICASAASDVLSRIKKWNKSCSRNMEIHIRIGMHYGQSLIEPNGDRHGQAVHVTFRIEGLKYKDIKKARYILTPKDFPVEDRIFTSADFFEMLDEKRKAKSRNLGFFKLKGIKGYYEIHELT
jgi:pSer/pThr/pTyr-binding forkhead associated (FHA) protein